MQNAEHNGTTLILGGNGKTGRRVAERLTKRGVPVRIGSRSGKPAFDWEDEATWPAALEGVRAAYITYYSDLAFPGAAEAVDRFAKAAVQSGVKRLVLLSGRGEDGAQRGERAVQASGAEWTIVRASFFNQNFSEGFLVEPLVTGDVAFPAGDVREPFIDVDDIADVAAAALIEDWHVGQLYEVTGPRLLTFAEATAEIAKAAGREIRYTTVSLDDYNAMLVEYGVPADYAAQLTDLLRDVLDGRNASLSDGVQRALGREPRDFSDYVRETAATGVWNPATAAEARSM